MFFLLFSLRKRYRNLVFKSAIWMLPILVVMLISLAHSRNSFYGLSKIEGAVLVTVVSSSLVSFFVEKFGNIRFLKYFIGVSFFVLVLTIFQRYAQGLEGREGVFFLNGAIMFGSLMGANLLASMYLFFLEKRKRYLVYSICFIGAVLWTQSKGPLVASALTGVLLYIYFSWRYFLSPRNIIILLLCVFCVFLSYEYIFQYVAENNFRLFALARIIKGDISDSDEGSIIIRASALADSFDLWLSHPIFGVGLGDWGEYLGSNGLRYPHNVVAETISEQGLLGIFVLLCFIFALLFRSQAVHGFFLIYFFTALSFSGDASYWRLIFFYPLSYAVLNSRLGDRIGWPEQVKVKKF